MFLYFHNALRCAKKHNALEGYAAENRFPKDHFSAKEFVLADVAPAALQQFSPMTRLQIRVYQFLKQLPLVSSLFKWIGPGWDILLRKTSL